MKPTKRTTRTTPGKVESKKKQGNGKQTTKQSSKQSAKKVTDARISKATTSAGRSKAVEVSCSTAKSSTSNIKVISEHQETLINDNGEFFYCI